MPKYAHIDVETGECIGVYFLSGEVERDNMILLSEEDNVNIMDSYADGVWTPAPPPEPIPVGESDAEKISRLEAENTDLRSRVSDIELAFADIIAGGGV